MTAQLPSRERLEEVVSYDLNEFCENPGLREEWQLFARALLAAHEQEPVAVVELSDFVTAAQLSGDEPRKKAVRELYEGALVIGKNLYANPAPSIPAAVPENQNTPHFDTIALDTAREIMCDVNRREDFLGGDIQLLSRIQCRIDDACRAAMLNHSGDATEKVNSPVIPDGYVLMPMKLTAENGAKYALSGEFHVLHRVTCHECGGEGCSDCDNDGWLEEKIMIGWDDIKGIYRAAVEACSIKSTAEGV